MIGKAEDPIIRRRIGRKQTPIVYSRDSNKHTKTIETNVADQVKRAFSDEEAKILSKLCIDIEKHYSEVHGHATPMDTEWAKDGDTGELFVVQARPETVRSRLKEGWLTTVAISDHGPVVLEGTVIGSDAACGTARVINTLAVIATMQPEEILVADMTDPDWSLPFGLRRLS